MNSIFYSLVGIIALAVLAIPLAQASQESLLDLTLVGNSIIDLNSLEKDRMLRVYAEFVNFDPSDEYFLMEIIQEATGKTVSESVINVQSTSESLINFNSFVYYMVNENDICADEIESKSEIQTDCSNIMTGEYLIKVISKDQNIIKTEKFSIIDTRED